MALLLSLAVFALLAPATFAQVALVSIPAPHNALADAGCAPQRIHGGESISNGLLKLVVEKDCSLNLYRGLVLRPIWSLSSGLPTKDCYLYLDNQGVLYVYPNDIRISPKAIFGTPGDYGRYALVLGQGKLGIYGKAIWSNGAAGPNPEYAPALLQLPSLAATAKNLIFSGDKFTGKDNGDVQLAKQGDVMAVIRPDCTLAVKAKNGTVIWSTWTQHVLEGKCTLKLKDNGELVLRDALSKFENLQFAKDGTTVWSSGITDGEKLYVCVLWCSGEMVIYGEKEFMYKPSIGSSIRTGMLMFA